MNYLFFILMLMIIFFSAAFPLSMLYFFIRDGFLRVNESFSINKAGE